jgi:hypothetical protein
MPKDVEESRKQEEKPEEDDGFVYSLTNSTDFRKVCPKLMYDYIYTHFDVHFRTNKDLGYFHPLSANEKQPDWKAKRQQHHNIWSHTDTFFKSQFWHYLADTNGTDLSIQAYTNPEEVMLAIAN